MKEKINFKDNKVFIGSIVGVLVLILLTVGATYAYFTFSADNQFGSQTIEATTEAIGSGVVLTKVGDGLTLEVSASEMLEENIGTNYYASGSEEPATIGKITVTGDGTYTCSYTMKVTKTSSTEDKDLYERFQGFDNKSEGQIYLSINETRYDFNTSNLFPIEYTNNIVVNNSEEKYITANMVIANTNIDQTILNDADISITFEVTEFNCTYVDNSTKPIINSITKTSDEQESITISVNASSTNGIDKYYYSIGDGAYIESEINTYTFNNLNAGTEHTIKVYVSDIYGLASEVNIQTYSTAEPNYICESGTLVGTCLQDNPTMGLNTTMEGGLYRFQGTDVNNYVCFGTSDKSTCTGNTDAYMYRIIGINSSGQLKLIKNEALNSTMQWYSDYTTNITWPQSTIYSNLNGSSFLTNTTYVPSGWSDKIATTTWKYGDNTTDDTTASSLYSIENEWTSTISAKIGLMYLHDYYYAYQSGGLNCGNAEIYTTCINAWLHISKCDFEAQNVNEWTMSRYGYYGGGGYLAWFVSRNGDGYWHALYVSSAIRPTFYLTQDVQYVSGTGTESDPFILE